MDITISDNTVYGSSGQGINVECSGATVSSNTVIRCASNGIQVRNESDRACSYVVTGNTVIQSGGTGIFAIPPIRGATAGTSSLVISGNTVDTTAASGMQVGNTAGLRIRNASVTGNVIINAGTTGYLLQHIDGLAFTANNLEGAGTASAGVRAANCKKFNINGNTILHVSGTTIPVIIITGTAAGDSNNGLISNNVCQTVTGTTAQVGISLSNNVQYTGVFGNNARGTGGVTLGSGTGNAQANNIL